MPEFKDAGHRDHARHTGEVPTTKIDRGPAALRVTLDQWGPWNPSVMDAYLQSNWGEHPMNRKLTNDGSIPAMVTSCFEGRTLAQILEGITFWFTIDGVCRPATHQIVRTRDAAFMQHGGRDNDWRHRGFSMPETVARLIDVEEAYEAQKSSWVGLKGPDRATAKMEALNRAYESTNAQAATDYAPLDLFLDWRASRGMDDSGEAYPAIKTVTAELIDYAKNVYAMLVDMGIPWQDARRFLPMGTQTYIHGIYNYRTLQQTLANRLEFIMDWEYNCVGQLMVRELRRHCPEVVWKPIKSASDKAMKAAFAGLESWPPDGKWLNPGEVCGHDYGDRLCRLPRKDHGDDGHSFVPLDPIERTHRPEQNPFWVLTEDALNGGPVEWIATNGTYPHDNPKAPKAYTPEA